MAHMDQESERTEKSTSERDLQQVQNAKSNILKTMINPFLVSCENLMNISSGETTQAVELIEARQKGMDALEKTEQSNAQKVDPVKLKTFVEKAKNKSSLKQAKERHAEERSVIRYLCFAENLGQKEKAEAFAHEWTKYPSSIFEPDALHPNGFAMRKGNKSDYGTMLKTTMAEQWKENEDLPAADLKTGYFIDLMAFIQRYQKLGCSTFQELSWKYLQKLLEARPQNCDLIHVVGDRYDLSQETSLKGEERMRRQKKSKKGRSFIPHDNLQLPPWDGFLNNRDNKQHLEEYLVQSWTSHPEWIPAGCTFILGGMMTGPAKHVLNADVSDIKCLACEDHEEADTRLFAHIAFSAKEQGCGRAVIFATDTDVLMLGIFHASRIYGLLELWMQKPGTFIPCHWIAEYLGKTYSNSTSSAILSAYALTGCDTVSYLFNCGKKRALKVALECDEILQPLTEYGTPESNTELSEAILHSATKYICALYGKKGFLGPWMSYVVNCFRPKDQTSDPCHQQQMHFISTSGGPYIRYLSGKGQHVSPSHYHLQQNLVEVLKRDI